MSKSKKKKTEQNQIDPAFVQLLLTTFGCIGGPSPTEQALMNRVSKLEGQVEALIAAKK